LITKKHIWLRSQTSRWGVGTWTLLAFLILAIVTGLTRTTLARDQKPTQTPPAFLETQIPGSEPWGLAQDHADNIWLAAPACDPSIYTHPICPATVQGKLLEYTDSSFSNGVQPLHSYQEPAGYSSPFFVAADARNNIWFTEPVTNALGELDNQGRWHQWTVSTLDASPFDLVIDQYGHIWFTEPGINAIGSFDPGAQQFTSTTIPTRNSDPYGITGPDPSTGSLWFTENNNSVHRIGRITPDSDGSVQGNIQEYIAPANNNNTPHLITFDDQGNIWWTEGWAANLGKLVIRQAISGTSKGITEYQVPHPACPVKSSCGTHISGISAESNGVIWFDDSLSSRIGSYTPDKGFTMYVVEGNLTSNAHPHDGLLIDSNANLWFSEEFSARLVKKAV
jgi:streptogramin lyase